MANVINLEAYRIYKNIKDMLNNDGIVCQFKYNDPVYVEWCRRYVDHKISWGEFYAGIAGYAMNING